MCCNRRNMCGCLGNSCGRCNCGCGNNNGCGCPWNNRSREYQAGFNDGYRLGYCEGFEAGVASRSTPVCGGGGAVISGGCGCN